MTKKAPIKTISAAKFDRMFDDGEDVSAYIDWNTEIQGFPARLPTAKAQAKSVALHVSPAPSKTLARSKPIRAR